MVRAFLEANDVQQDDLARALRMSGASVSRKLSGARPWFQEEIDSMLVFLSKRLRRKVTYEELFRPQMVGAERR